MDSKRNKIPATAVVLAGGGSRRMGRDKASLPWRGTALGPYVAGRLGRWFETVLVSADRPGAFADTSLPVVPDVFEGAGILGGLHAGLSAASTDWVFLVGCDMPFVREALVRFLWARRAGGDAVVPAVEKGLESACAFYARDGLPAVTRALRSGRKRVVSFFPDVRVHLLPPEEWRTADPDGVSFRNLNTPEEYAKYYALYGREG